jgi:hypothetical protein
MHKSVLIAFIKECPCRYKYKFEYLEKQEQLRVYWEQLSKKEISEQEYENRLILAGIKWVDAG